MRFDAAIDRDGDVWVKRPDDPCWRCATTAYDRLTDDELNRDFGPIAYTELAESV